MQHTTTTLVSPPTQKPPVVPKQYLLAFILTTCCFSLWGFANDFTNPLVKVYENVFIIPTSDASWLQFGFYFGYFCMALPAVFLIRKFSYKAAIILGLLIYAIGCLIAYPASIHLSFPLLVLGSYIIPCGLAFLETACNPYILAMGDPRTATRRLNLAQAFNPIGSLTGMAIVTFVVAANLETSKFTEGLSADAPSRTQYLFTPASTLPEGATIIREVTTGNDGKKVNGTIDLGGGVEVPLYPELPSISEKPANQRADYTAPALKGYNAKAPEEFKDLQTRDLTTIRSVYIALAVFILGFLFIFLFSKLPVLKEEEADAPFLEVTGRILRRPKYAMGVVSQAFYVAAQIMCWTYIIHYGINEVGLTLKEAQLWNMCGSSALFLSFRFLCTYLLRTISAGKLLFIFALGGFIFTVGAIYLPGYSGLVSLVFVSACMSLMFPTIYGIALGGMKQEEAKMGSAFLIMSIVGGAIGAKIQGSVIDLTSVRTSFWLVTVCFVVIAIYGFLTYSKYEKEA